jgi:uncharacterized protein (DUF1697 family)
MAQYVAFLRAINTPGRRVKMDHLRSVFAAAGYHNVASHIASGNIIFESDDPVSTEGLGAMIEHSYGFHSQVFLRTRDEVLSVLERVPWRHEGAEVEVAFLERVPDPSAARTLEATATGEEALAVDGREMYWLRAGLQADSTHKESTVVRILEMQTTRRALRTVEQIAAKYLA